LSESDFTALLAQSEIFQVAVDTLHQPRNTATINYEFLSMTSGTIGVDLARWSDLLASE